MALCTGGRFAELLALQWEDFDQARSTVRFRRQAVNEGTRSIKGTKGDKNRTALVLPSYWEFHKTNERGRIVHLKRPMTRIIAKAGIKEPGILNHAARHTYARVCVERGVPLEALQKYLGHASIVTTQKAYGWMRVEVAVEMGRRVFYGT